jgi:hypothetical protein
MSYDEQLELTRGYAARLDAEQGEQGGVDWLMSRVAHVTASRFRDVLDFTKAGKAGAKRTSYLWDVVVERLTGQPTEHFVNAAMEHGTQNEPMARMAYESRTGNIVAETGFLHHTAIKWVGGSPDGLVDADGLIEIKAPTTKTMCQLLIDQDLSDYMPQMQGLMWITGRQWCDFVCYDPRLPDGLSLYIERVLRDEDYIAELAGNVLQFLSEVEELHSRLMALKLQ